MTESTKFGSSKSSVMVGEGSRKFEETIRIYSGEMASADLGHLALCGYIHLEICGCMESLQNSLGDPTGPQLNLHQWLQNPNEQCHSGYVRRATGTWAISVLSRLNGPTAPTAPTARAVTCLGPSFRPLARLLAPAIDVTLIGSGALFLFLVSFHVLIISIDRSSIQVRATHVRPLPSSPLLSSPLLHASRSLPGGVASILRPGCETTTPELTHTGPVRRVITQYQSHPPASCSPYSFTSGLGHIRTCEEGGLKF